MWIPKRVQNNNCEDPKVQLGSNHEQIGVQTQESMEGLESQRQYMVNQINEPQIIRSGTWFSSGSQSHWGKPVRLKLGLRTRCQLHVKADSEFDNCIMVIRILENAKDNITGTTYPQRGKFLFGTVLKILKSLKFFPLEFISSFPTKKWIQSMNNPPQLKKKLTKNSVRHIKLLKTEF